MPYFVYKVSDKRELEALGVFPKYREARQKVRDLRSEGGPDSVDTFRMIFAKTDVEAEKLLKTPRDERVIGED